MLKENPAFWEQKPGRISDQLLLQLLGIQHRDFFLMFSPWGIREITDVGSLLIKERERFLNCTVPKLGHVAVWKTI